MVPKEAAIFLPFRLLRSPAAMPEVLAGDDRHGGVGAELGGVAAVVAERDEVHAAQHRADHRHADLHDLALAGLQRVERVDAGGVGPRDVDVEALLLEEAALQRDGQADLVDAGDHAGLRVSRASAPAPRPAAAAVRTTSISNTSHSPSILLVAAARHASPNRAGPALARSARFTPRTSTALSCVPETLP